MRSVTILGITLWIFGLYAQGVLSAESAAFWLVLLVGAFSAALWIGGKVWRVLTIGLVIAGLVTFLAEYGGGSPEEMMAIAAQLAVVCAALFGFHLIVSAPFRGRR